MSKKVEPSMIETSQGKGKWASKTYVQDTLLKVEKVKKNMLERCVKAIEKHKHGAKADVHPGTRVYHVTANEAFYRHGGTNMVRVSLGSTGQNVTVFNGKEQWRIKLEKPVASRQPDTTPVTQGDDAAAPAA